MREDARKPAAGGKGAWMFGRVPLAVFGLIAANDLLDTAAQVLMKMGMGEVGSLFFWTALLIYAANFLLWMKILSLAQLSIALPLASASYLLIPLIAVVFLHEQITLSYWAAIGLILAGIFLVAQSGQSAQSASQNRPG